MAGLIELAFYETVRDDSSLDALRSSRLYYGKAKAQCGTPYQTYRRLDDSADRYMGGTTRLHRAMFRVTSCGASSTDAMQLDITTKNVLIPIRASIGSGSNVFTVRRINWFGEDGDFEPIEGRDTGLFVYRSRYEVIYFGVGADFD